VPNEDQIKILIDPTVLAQVDAVCPSYLSRTAFINQAVDLYLNGVDTGITLIKPSAPQAGPRPFGADGFISNKEVIEEKEIKTRKKSPKDPFSSKTLDPDLVPAELQDCHEQVVAFWAVKKGTRSERSAEMLFNKLLAMSPSDRIKALDAAYNAQWASVFEPKSGTPTQSRANTGYTQPEFKHPAHQVFTAADFN
jgi:hypothetical protein